MIYTAQVISRSETLNERACTARTVTIYILYDTCMHAISCSGRCYCQTIIQSHDSIPPPAQHCSVLQFILYY